MTGFDPTSLCGATPGEQRYNFVGMTGFDPTSLCGATPGEQRYNFVGMTGFDPTSLCGATPGEQRYNFVGMTGFDSVILRMCIPDRGWRRFPSPTVANLNCQNSFRASRNRWSLRLFGEVGFRPCVRLSFPFCGNAFHL